MSESGTGDIEERLARLEQQDQRLTRALELLARHEAAPAAKAGRNWDSCAAVIASFIGILALAISGYTAYVQRQQLRAQVWPHLRVIFSGVHLSFSAINQGTGPARVTAVRVTVDGAPVGTWSDVKKMAGFTDKERFAISTLSTAVLSAGTDFTIAKADDDEQSQAKFKELLPGKKHALSFTVCYCSVLDDCWVAYLGNPGYDHIPETCPITAAERFRD